MKKRLLVIPLLGLMLSGCNVSFNSEENENEEQENLTWSNDNSSHWQMSNGERINKGSHTFEIDNEKTYQATCKTPGQLVQTCTVCGFEKVATIQTLAHNYVEQTSESTAATCGKAGEKVEKCTNCGDVKKTSIPTTAHNYVTKNDASHVNVASTCKTAGYHWEYCSGCGNWNQVSESLSTVHTWNDGEVTKQPTAVASGIRTYTCTVCGKTKTESIAPSADSSEKGNFTFNSDIETAQSIHTTNQANFLKYSKEYYNITSAELNSYNATGNAENSFPNQVTVTWNHTVPAGKTVKNYQVLTGQKSDLSDGYLITGTTAKSVSFYNAFLGDNYFRVIANFTDGSSEISDIKIFKVEETAPRNLKVGTMSNCRDMGGRTTVAGGKLRQGLIYRTSDPATSGVGDVSEWTTRMGIKSEIYVKDGSNSSGPLGSSVKFYNASMDYGATPYSNFARNAERLRYVFEILGDESNYPAMYHCRIGTDRTGICGVAINGVLGVPFNEIIQDYAFSNFGKIDGQRYAHKDNDTNGDDIAKYIDAILEMPGKNFQEQTYYALLSIGVKAEHINTLINMMTEGTKATLPTNVTVANGSALTVAGGSKKTASDHKNPDVYYEISGTSQSVSYGYTAAKSGKATIVVYLGSTNSSSSTKLSAGIDLKIDGSSQTISNSKTYYLAGFGTTQQNRRTGYMFNVLGEYDLTAGAHTITIAGKNSDKFNIGSIEIISEESEPEPIGGDPDSPSTDPIRFEVVNATGYNSPNTKMKSTSTWAVNSTTLPAGNYKISVELKITDSTHASQTLWESSTNPTYTVYVGDTAIQPEDKTSTRNDLGINTSTFTAITYATSFAVGTNISEVKITYTASGYSMYVNALIFTPVA